MAQTSQEIRREWDKRNMRFFNVAAHNEHDKALIEFIEERRQEGHSMSSTFKEGVYKLMECE